MPEENTDPKSLPEVQADPEDQPQAAPEPEAQPQQSGKQFTCPECNKGLSSKHAVKNHMQKYHPKAQSRTSSRSERVVRETKTREQCREKDSEANNFLNRLFFRR